MRSLAGSPGDRERPMPALRVVAVPAGSPEPPRPEVRNGDPVDSTNPQLGIRWEIPGVETGGRAFRVRRAHERWAAVGKYPL